MARPKKTVKDFPTDWVVEVIMLYGKGASRVEVSMYLNIADSTWARLMDESKEFSRTIKKGTRISEAWWERQGRTNLHSKTFNPTLWYMNMKNRFGWRDRHDITSGNEPIKSLTKNEANEIAAEIHTLFNEDKKNNKDQKVATNATKPGKKKGPGKKQ